MPPNSLPFDQAFHKNADGTLTPLKNIKIGNTTIGPDLTFGPGVSFEGINFFDFEGRALAVEPEGDLLVLKGFFQ